MFWAVIGGDTPFKLLMVEEGREDGYEAYTHLLKHFF